VKAVQFVVPADLDDPAKPTGGNVYDHRIGRGLARSGWQVTRHAAPGSWPWPEPEAERALARWIGGVSDGAVVLIDDLIASTVPDILIPQADRLRLVVLVHMSLGEAPPGHQVADAEAREGAVLAAAASVITTSSWTRDRLLLRYPLPAGKVHVAEPGVDPAGLAAGTERGGELLCVAAVTAHKGHHVLLSALAATADLPWRCVCVGTLDREPGFVERLRQQAEQAGIADRVCFSGLRTGGDLARAYANADVFVLASQAETYGMVVTEALSRGLPVVATAVGGLPEALSRTSDGRRPGLLVPPDDSVALAAALRRWLTDAGLRQFLREAARERRATLSGWDLTTDRIAHVLTQVAA
jgi:glycosyltransferase involved in cell wall biosynthesis